MWDEKKFFEDFVRESDKVKADEAFVQELKELEHGKVRRFPYVKYAASIAAVAACVGIGIFAFGSGSTGNQGNPSVLESNPGIMAGADTENIDSGSIGVNNEDVGAWVRKKVKKRSTIVTDREGNALSGKQRVALNRLLEDAVFVEGELEGEYTQYHCEGDKSFDMRIIEDADGVKVSVENIVF